MGRLFQIDVEIEDFDPYQMTAITDVLNDFPDELLDFMHKWPDPLRISCGGKVRIGSGKGVDGDYCQDLCENIWKANRAFCKVKMKATSLEELPYENYSFGKGDYYRFQKRG